MGKQLREDFGYLTVEVPATVEKLGMISSGLPPKEVILSEIAPGGWADLQGIKSGDTLVAVNGLNIDEVTGETFKREMSSRPLELRLIHNRLDREPGREIVWGPIKEDGRRSLTVTAGPGLRTDGSQKLGLSFEGVPPAQQVVVREVTPDGWADEHCIKPGDVLLALNGRAPCKMTGGQDEFNKYRMMRPLEMVFEVVRAEAESCLDAITVVRTVHDLQEDGSHNDASTVVRSVDAVLEDGHQNWENVPETLGNLRPSWLSMFTRRTQYPWLVGLLCLMSFAMSRKRDVFYRMYSAFARRS